jgi:hypothetical protein
LQHHTKHMCHLASSAVEELLCIDNNAYSNWHHLSTDVP